MPDITMCRDVACPLRAGCYRYTAKPSEHRQSYFASSPREGDKCDHYQPNVKRFAPPKVNK